jgi:hypothetical protein
MYLFALNNLLLSPLAIFLFPHAPAPIAKIAKVALNTWLQSCMLLYWRLKGAYGTVLASEDHGVAREGMDGL